ncbi:MULTISPECIES: glycerol dehydratase reactivase beta/small subunit family protein [unclassified Bilifractor]|uniref:glycerol dehydratase reactivase beta/small subunit family protein n=1 Tax=unclassified Bilifractor TaxID=2815795 RepID=UPI003F9287F2
MISQRPSIFIYTHRADNDFLREIQAGIEEENVASEVFEMDESDADILASDACNASMMGSGIGISGENVSFQMRGRRPGECVCSVHMPTFAACRIIGSNSARVMKKQCLRDLE